MVNHSVSGESHNLNPIQYITGRGVITLVILLDCAVQILSNFPKLNKESKGFDLSSTDGFPTCGFLSR